MANKIRIENLYKIFGKAPDEAIELLNQGVSKDEILNSTGNVVGLADVSFDVDEGEVFVAMGLSGSGKSTLIRCLNRLITPTTGKVYVNDEDIVQASEDRLREIRRTTFSMVFQHFGLFPHKTVLENAEYGLKIRGMDQEERRQKAMETLKMVGLGGWADYHPENLSGGMQQRVGLARALTTDPEILLMDEAFSALDPLIRREMQDELIDMQQTLHKTIVFITHDLNEALKLGDRIAVMRDGRIIQIGDPEDIVSNPADQYVADFTQDVDRGRVFTASSIMETPEALHVGHDTVRTAMYRMRELSRDALYVVDRDRKPVGLVVDQDIARAVREGVRDLAHVMNIDFPQAVETASLSEMYGLFTAGWPVAIVDDRGRLRGVVNQFDVLVNLTTDSNNGGTANGDAAETSESTGRKVS